MSVTRTLTLTLLLGILAPAAARADGMIIPFLGVNFGGNSGKAISDAIGSRWYYYMKAKMDLVSVGTAVISAEVDEAGHVTNLRVVSNSANESFANICLQSFQEAKIAPIPPELIPTLPDGRMQLEFTFTTYANQ